MIITIESRSNEKIKTALKLSESSRFRREKGEFFLEGMRLCSDAAESGTELRQLFFTEKARLKNPEKVDWLISCSDSAYLISEEIAAKIADTQSNQGVFAVCGMRDRADCKLHKVGRYIALENIQDPANLGAIIRTAEALGIDAAIISRCCDCYNPKAQRAAMGSLLRLPMIFCENLPIFLTECKTSGIRVFASTPDENATPVTSVRLNGAAIVVIGNEGNGVSPETMAVCEKLTVPMKGRAESLNASMAAAILMWEMMK